MHEENVLLVPLWFETTLHLKEQDHAKNGENLPCDLKFFLLPFCFVKIHLF